MCAYRLYLSVNIDAYHRECGPQINTNSCQTKNKIVSYQFSDIYRLIHQTNSKNRYAAWENGWGSRASDLLVTLPRNPIAAMAAQTASMKRQKTNNMQTWGQKITVIAKKNRSWHGVYWSVRPIYSLSLRPMFDELSSLSIDWLRIQLMPTSHLSVLNAHQYFK